MGEVPVEKRYRIGSAALGRISSSLFFKFLQRQLLDSHDGSR